MTRVMMVDDHQIIRDGIRQLLADENDIQIVGEAGTVKDALRLLDVMKVDVLITDISMPGGTGFDLIKTLQQDKKEVKVMVLSMHDEDAYIKKAIELGVNGYVTKDISKYEFVQAIYTIASGEMYFADKVSRVMISNLVKRARRNEENDNPQQKLTQREREILKLIVVENLTSTAIADKLFISHRTVENHRANIMNKLKAKNTAELVKKALENQLLENF